MRNSYFIQRAGLAVLALLCAVTSSCARNKGAAMAPAKLGEPESREFGGAIQELEDRGSHVYCRVRGRGSITGGVGGMKDVFRYARENGRSRILLDVWEAEVGTLSVPEIIIGTCGLLPFWDWSTRIAVYMPDETLPTLVSRFSFPEGMIRLIKLRRFATVPEAEAWLMRDD